LSRSVNEPLQVFLLHWNEPEGCTKAVRAFLGQTVPVRLTVIDNGSSPEKRGSGQVAVLQHPAHVRVLDEDHVESTRDIRDELVQGILPYIRNTYMESGELGSSLSHFFYTGSYLPLRIDALTEKFSIALAAYSLH